ncbi:hypothetical protein UXO14_13955 [Enterobacter hormaechei]
MAEDTLIVEAVPTWPATYNYSIITNPDTGKPSIQERVRRADAYQNGTMTALKLEQCLKVQPRSKICYAPQLMQKSYAPHLITRCTKLTI